MSFESAITFFIAIFIFGITPGPGIFAIIARAMVEGSRSCFLLALGMVSSDIVYLVLACLGLAAIAEHWGELFTIIRFTGAAYLCYLGWKLWTTPIDLCEDTPVSKPRHGIKSFLQGFLISASNPKVILFYIAFLPTFMNLSVLSIADIALASVLQLFALMLGVMLIAHMASKARRIFRSAKAMRNLNRSAGSIMIGAGAFLATRH
ncbi:LysE family translocator [Neptunomonas qingdaonensis]|uniref:Threonine/homoserine/homoserine lactone efflux protein n=1 Tax=Neptunomonas qingdaonensis TaxID=1045558 RepID=A0A1I2LTG9_9GAMM|nr:LysE family translocator [Neptunomonas qingdaonensis]SFF80371.1 Threonine/homoserine/homoserine lactone efflux protein [Neptunomonas qingdaonensis]